MRVKIYKLISINMFVTTVMIKNNSDDKELAAATLHSISLNYCKRKGPAPPKAMLRAIGQLKKRDDIVITKPNKGSGVVVMDKSDYVRLLKESSINDMTKFIPVSVERPKTRGRPPEALPSITSEGEGVILGCTKDFT